MKRCIYCGRDNDEKREFCKYCGEALNQSEYADYQSPEVEVVDDHEKTHSHENHTIKCPRCGSSKIFLVTKESGGFDGSNACCGYLLFGPFGLLCGLASDRESVTARKCQNCGYKF